MDMDHRLVLLSLNLEDSFGIKFESKISVCLKPWVQERRLLTITCLAIWSRASDSSANTSCVLSRCLARVRSVSISTVIWWGAVTPWPGGSPDTSNGTCGGENLESVSHHYCSRVRLSLFIFSNGSFSANLTGLLKEGWIWTHPEQSPDGLDKITDTRLGQNLTENSQSRLSDCYCCHRNSGWCR